MSRTLIIGGGVIGLAVAYHLARRGVRDVVLLERNSLTSGTSWHAAGIVGPLRATPNMTRLAAHALELFPRLEAETGMSTGYARTGGYWLARDPARLDELHRIAAVGRVQGLAPQTIGVAEVDVPGLDLSHHAGALFVPEDGTVNPVDLCMAYAAAARAQGVDIRENTAVVDLLFEEGRVTGVKLPDGPMRADRVVLCTGVWSRELAGRAGVALPLQAVQHMYVVTAPIPGLPVPFPVIRDLDTGIYIKGDAGKLVIGGFEPDAKCWNPYGPEGDRPFLELPEDWDQFAPFMQAALDLMPGLADTGIQHFMNGPESFTADTKPLVGEVPGVAGLFVAAGMNSVGVMSSAGIGRALADWIVDGHPPFDLWEVDVARVDPLTATPAHMAARMTEAVSDLFALHWPHKQPRAGRGLRKSVLHEKWAGQGAVFGLTAGWERGLWYARSEAERDLPYSIGAQPWQAIAEREAAAMATGAAMLDLSPLTKIDITGPGALAAVDGLTCRNLRAGAGRCYYAPFLNPCGGIELDATVTVFSDSHLRVVTGAATRWRDLDYLRRHLTGTGVAVFDRTEGFAVIGVMGAAARDVLASLSQDDWADFPFGAARAVGVAGCDIWAKRLSFVGELGWELWIHVGSGPAEVFDALIAAGVRPMGHYALEAARIEKGFLHWSHEIGPEVTPLEAGLGFTVDWSKDFTCKAALERQRRDGPARRLVLMQVTGDPLLLHDEPVFEAGRCVGLTSSGAKGVRTGLALAFGMIDIAPGETRAQTCARQFEIEVAGARYRARPLARAPYDPAGERMRA